MYESNSVDTSHNYTSWNSLSFSCNILKNKKNAYLLLDRDSEVHHDLDTVKAVISINTVAKDYKIEWEACLHMYYYKEERRLSASTVTQVVFKILYAHAYTYNKNVYMNLKCEYVYKGIIWEKVTC